MEYQSGRKVPRIFVPPETLGKLRVFGPLFSIKNRHRTLAKGGGRMLSQGQL
jgi:hypothetical protein